MWQNWVNGILGLWLILMGFLGLPASFSRVLLIITGIIVAILGFWAGSSGVKGESPETAEDSGEREQPTNESF